MMIPEAFQEPPGEGPRLFLSVGDHSGDLHGALLIQELKKQYPSLRIEGLGGDKMIEAGLHCHYNMLEGLAVMGIWPVLLKLPTLGKLYDQLYRYFESSPPDLVVFLDYPGFNLFLSKKAKQCKIPTFYYVVPQLWAWAPWRIERVKKRIDRMSVLFEFEKEWYQSRGMDQVETAGHPLYDHLAHKKLNSKVLKTIEEYQGDKSVIVLVPGSRTREVKGNLEGMILASKILQKKQGERSQDSFVFVIPCAKKKLYHLIKKVLRENEFKALVLPGFAHEAMSKARVAIATSGTVTVELLYYRVPTVVVYRIGTLAHYALQFLQKIGVRFLQCDWITLVNILAKEEVYPERLHHHLSPEWIANKVLPLAQEGEERQKCLDKIEKLHQNQIRGGASVRASQQILGYLRELESDKKQNRS